MMKKKSIIFYIAALFVAVSCSDSFLDSSPITDQTAQGYFQTPKNALEGLVGCYNGLVLDGWGNLYMVSTIASDEAFAGGGTGEASSGVPYGWDHFEDGGAYNQNIELWKNKYTAIYRCNSYLENLGTVNWGGDEALASQYKAEARFLRAFNYFDLVRFFGNIPLVTTSSVDEKTKQSDPKLVYAQIVEDLKFAIGNLPDVPYKMINKNDYGHATKWAAEALMVRVFLFYTGRYSQTDLVGVVTKAQALTYAEDVVNNSGHDLIGEFKNLWPVATVSGQGLYAGEDNIETVYAIKYTWGSHWGGKGGNQWIITTGLRWHDGTPAPYSWGWGQGTVTKKYGEDVYEPGDLRKTATIISVKDELMDSVSTEAADGTVDNTGAPFNFSAFADYTGYFNKKYVPLTASMTDLTEYPISQNESNHVMVDQDQDWVIIRFADVLLMAAELGSPNAQAYLDRIRDRAFGDEAHRVTATTENIRKERQRELALEGIRYWDLLRYGSDVAAQEINITDEIVMEGGEDKTKTIVFDTEKDGLFQIPQDEIDKSVFDNVKYLIQNPGW